MLFLSIFCYTLLEKYGQIPALYSALFVFIMIFVIDTFLENKFDRIGNKNL